MSFQHGKGGALWVGAFDLTRYTKSFDFSADTDAADASTMGSDWKRVLPGQTGGKLDVSGLYDPLAVESLEGLLQLAGGVPISAMPGGAAIGARARLIKGNESSYAETTPIGDLVSFDWSAMSDDTIGFGRVLHAMSAETADANGTTYDGAASSATGAIAHLHVGSVSAADSVIVTVEDASVPSGGGANWATIGTFASKSAPGSERIVIAGTVRRYLRAVWDVTGSSVSIVFGVTLART